MNTAGPLAKLEFVDPGGYVLQVELGRDQYNDLRLESGGRYYVRPRRVRVFVSDEAEAAARPAR